MYFLSQTTAVLAGSSAFAALIWWVVPAAGLIGGIGYVVWISKFKRKFESETSRSVGQFQRFQESFRTEEVHIAKSEIDNQMDTHVDRDKL